VSLSMLIEDYFVGSRTTNRIVAAKKVLTDFIKGRPADRIGIVAFAGAPYVPCPPTLDHDWLLQNMDRIQPGIMEDGTAIGSGIATAARRLDQPDTKSKVIVLITDGANNSGKLSPTDAARLAAALGIRIYTIGLGTPGDHPIRLPSGQIIHSGRDEFDEESLKKIAEIGHGMFFRGQDSSSLERVFREINEMEKTEVQRSLIVHTDDLFDYFLIPAVALFVLYLLWKATAAHTAPVTA
jgi:Ca-activated chloride channel homolog